MRPSLWLSAIFIVGLFLLLAAHMHFFRISIGWMLRHIFLMGLACFIPLILVIWGNRKLAIVGALVLGLLFALQILALLIQYFARLEIANNVPAALLVDNWSALQPFLNWWEYTLIPIVILVFGFAVGLAQHRIWRAMPRRISTALAVTGLCTTLALMVAFGHFNRLTGDPVLALIGAPAVETSSERIITLTDREVAYREILPVTDVKPRENIVIFMPDSLRPDHLAQLGYHRNTLPFLDMVKDEFKHFDVRAGRSTCPASICGVVSTLSSRYFSFTPPYHALGLGQLLQHHGYETHFILASDHRRFGYAYYWKFMEREADAVYDFETSDAPTNSDRIIDEGIDALPPYDGKPKLIFVFFFSTHLNGQEEAAFERFGPYWKNKAAMRKERVFSAEDLASVAAHYDNKILQFDHHATRAFSILREKGYLENAIFAMLSDHGEGLGRNGFVGHSRLWESTLRIPFVLASNGPPLPDLSEVIPQQIDLAPTLADMLGIEIPEVWQGDSLFDADPDRPMFHEIGLKAGRSSQPCFAMVRAVQKRRLKFTQCREGTGPVEETLFDIERDPLQSTDLWDDLNQSAKAEWRQTLGNRFDLDFD